MARDKLTEYSATASENTVCGDVNIAENSALPSDLNNFAREVMSHLKAFSDGTDAIDALTVTGDLTVGDSHTIGDDANDNLQIKSSSGENIKYDSVGGTHLFLSNGSEKVRFQSGGGISFNGDTAAANALDDYEEGTWTPAFLSPSASFSYSTQQGSYTKIGRQVHCLFWIALNANPTGTTTNAVKLDNLPFGVGGGVTFYGGAIGYYFNVNVNNSAREVVYQVSTNQTHAELKQSGDAQGEINLLANSLSNGSTMRGSLTYFV